MLPFIIIAFAAAFLTSLLHWWLGSDRQMDASSVVFGLLLGVTNFGTLYFIMRALAIPGWDSSLVYPLNHFGVVLSSVVVGLVVFRESLPRAAAVGVILAVLSIFLLAVASN